MGKRFLGNFTLLAVASASTVRLVDGQAAPAQGSMFINEARPLAKAALTLEANFGLTVAYEDAEYAYSGDMVDMTSPAYKQTHPEAKALIPRKGILSLTVDPLTVSTGASGAAAVAQHLLDLHTVNGNAGQFKLLHLGDILAIVPAAVRDSSGVMLPTQSPLETRISLPSLERDGEQAIDDFGRSVSSASGKTILRSFPPSRQLVVTVGANDELAREVLVRIISGFHWKDPIVAKSPKLTWALLYDPGIKAYALNVYQVRRESQTPTGMTILTPVYR